MQRRDKHSKELTKSYQTKGVSMKNFKLVDAKEASVPCATITLPKRRKFSLLEDNRSVSTCSEDKEMQSEFRCYDGEIDFVDVCSSFCSEDVTASRSRCSRDDSSEIVKQRLRLVDLEANGFGIKNSSKMNRNFRRETSRTTKTNQIRRDSEEAEYPANQGRNIPEHKIPPQGEIEEFFAVAEERERLRFAEKYNYDIMRDVPLKGRYEWTPLNP